MLRLRAAGDRYIAAPTAHAQDVFEHAHRGQRGCGASHGLSSPATASPPYAGMLAENAKAAARCTVCHSFHRLELGQHQQIVCGCGAQHLARLPPAPRRLQPCSRLDRPHLSRHARDDVCRASGARSSHCCPAGSKPFPKTKPHSPFASSLALPPSLPSPTHLPALLGGGLAHSLQPGCAL